MRFVAELLLIVFNNILHIIITHRQKSLLDIILSQVYNSKELEL